MLGPDDDAHVGEPGIGERAQHVIEKGSIDGDHRFHAGVSDRRLLGRELRALVGGAHPRAQTARQHDGLCRRRHRAPTSREVIVG